MDLSNQVLSLGKTDKVVRAIYEVETARVLLQFDSSAAKLNGVAQTLATSPHAEVRNGSAAVGYAEAACKLTEFSNAVYVDTLAAAYAEKGDFDKAVQTQNKAIELAASDRAEGIRTRLELYKARRPFHEDENSTPSVTAAKDEETVEQGWSLDTITDKDLPRMLKAAKSKDSHARCLAVQGVARLLAKPDRRCDEETFAALSYAVMDSSAEVRAAATNALADSRRPEAALPIIRVLGAAERRYQVAGTADSYRRREPSNASVFGVREPHNARRVEN